MPTNYRGGGGVVDLVERCRQLRRGSTDAETVLWSLIRDRQLANVKFRRQHQFGPYVLDFYAPNRRLAVECDGSQHVSLAGGKRDAVRDAFLAANGVRVLRFSNVDVLVETEAVALAILSALEPPSP